MWRRTAGAGRNMLLFSLGPLPPASVDRPARPPATMPPRGPMSAARDFALTARLALGTAAVMFALIVVGSIVRTTGSGLACPDWPLCHGRLIPPLQFNILIEWFHRLLALVVGLLLLATAAWTLLRPGTRAILGGHAVVAV